MEGIGLDRTIVSNQIYLHDPDEFLARMKSLFKLEYNPLEKKEIKIKLEGYKDIFSEREFIKSITLVKQGYKGYLIYIDANYARYFNKTNYRLVTNEEDKKTVDRALKRIVLYLVIPDNLDIPEENKAVCRFEKIRKMDNLDIVVLDYRYLELAEQLKVNCFYKMNNALFFMFKSLCNKFIDAKDRCMYLNYKTTVDKFYTTGFSFKFLNGLELNYYSKTEENNKKNNDKEKGGVLKTELKMTKTHIKRMCGTTNIDDLTIKKLSMGINSEFREVIVEAIERQFETEEQLILEKLSRIKITPKNLELFVAINNESIIDADWFNSILYKELRNKKSRSSIFDYTKCVKEQLKELGEQNSPLRDNLNNLKRIEQLVKNLFGINLKIRSKNGEKLQFFIL